MSGDAQILEFRPKFFNQFDRPKRSGKADDSSNLIRRFSTCNYHITILLFITELSGLQLPESVSHNPTIILVLLRTFQAPPYPLAP